MSAHATACPPRVPARAARLIALSLVFCGLLAASSHAQFGGQHIPSASYRATFRSMYDGEYRDALRSYQSEGRGAIKVATTRWIDSICYHAMVGECLYEMGQLPEALDHYTAAINLYLAYPSWLTAVQYPAGGLRPARPVGARERVTWGQTKRASQPAAFSDKMKIGIGRLDAGRAFQEGGVVAKPMLISINAAEIVRCTTLAIRRRAELLGPASKHDSLTGKLLTTLAARPGLPNHWSECWLDVQLGLAQMAAGKDEQAAKSLQRSLLAAGQFDHPMTPVALFELGRLAVKRGDLKSAANHFLEATYLAAFYGDVRLVEEAFRHAAIVHMVANPKGLYPPLGEALNWAKRNRLRELSCSLLISMAENHAALGETAAASAELAEAAKYFARRDLGAARVGARHAFVGSRVLFQQGNVAAGEASLATAMQYMTQGSFWLFHITVADKMCVGNDVTRGTAMALYEQVLRDPLPEDWSFRPEESFATLVTPHFIPMEHWFELAAGRENHDKAIQIADRVRRHRFFSSLPFGGRLESLRWLLEASPAVLSDRAKLHRRDLRVALPRYDELSRKADAVRAALRQGPAVPEDPKDGVEQEKRFAELANLSTGQEILLREIAVSRQPADLIFPPLRATADVQKALPDGSAILAFFGTSRGMYAFLMNNARYESWLMGSQGTLRRKLALALRTMGQFDANRQMAMGDLASTKWHRGVQDLLAAIVANSPADFRSDFKELIIVPDGLLWYVPFEALEVVIDGEPQSLISRFQVRYAPTVGLAVPDGRRRKNVVRTGVVTGRLFPGDDPEVSREAFDRLSKVVPDATAIPQILPTGSALYRVLFDQVIAYDDIAAGKGGAYAWRPIQVERPNQGAALADWLSLPWGGPQTVVLPGFHTASESGLKRKATGAAPGQEMFLSVCGLMASGTRTVLLSRWRTGGPSAFLLTREFAQELPHTTPAEAWQRAVSIARESHMEPDKEPRVKSNASAADGDPPKLEHPFFWAGYMLIDSGDPPEPAPAKAMPAPKR